MIENPEQDEKLISERRILRQKQRELHTDLHAVKALVTDVESEKFQNLRNRLNEIFSNVSHPREQQNDALTFKELSIAAKEQSTNMADSAHRFDFTSLASKISNSFTRESEFSWSDFGENLGHINSGIPSFTTMLGPIGKDVKVRKVAVRKEKEVLGMSEKPEEIVRVEDEADEATNLRLKKMLEFIVEHTAEHDGKAAPYDLLSMLIDPVDHVQTIENFFDYSFLIKDKLVLQDVPEKTGLPIVISVNQQKIFETDFSSEKSQMILSISMQDLESLSKILYRDQSSTTQPHPLHRIDPLYNATNASEQALIISQQQKRSSEERKRRQQSQDSQQSGPLYSNSNSNNSSSSNNRDGQGTSSSSSRYNRMNAATNINNNNTVMSSVASSSATTKTTSQSISNSGKSSTPLTAEKGIRAEDPISPAATTSSNSSSSNSSIRLENTTPPNNSNNNDNAVTDSKSIKNGTKRSNIEDSVVVADGRGKRVRTDDTLGKTV